MPNSSGAAPCSILAGADRIPVRSPYPVGPNKASGSVPRAMVSIPLPAPCNSTKGTAATGPKIASNVAPSGWSPVARRAEIIADMRRRRPNSTSRAATCAGPTSDAAMTATEWLDPIACSRRGRCAAIAVDTNQVAPNTLARTIIVQGTPDGISGWCDVAGGGGNAFGTRSQFIGRPITRCNVAHAMHAPRQPNASMNAALVGQPTVLANPANKVMPVIALRALRP